MAAVSHQSLDIVRGEDIHVFDNKGRSYVDATAGLWYMNVGHGRQEIIDAITAQGRKLAVYSTFGDITNEPAEALASRLAQNAPDPDSKIFLVGGGGEAVDTAAKLARRYFAAVGMPSKSYVLHRHHSYHGTNGFGTSLSGMAPNRAGYGTMIPETREVDHEDPEALESAIVELGAENVAAFICEPVIGAGGVYPPSPGYLETVATICERHNVLFIVDAVICGFGRLGTYFAAERFGVAPDMITFAKGVTSGYQPLGGVVVNSRVAEPFYRPTDTAVFRHGPTYAGHPMACAAAIANLDILERESLIERGRDLEDALFDAMKPLDQLGIVKEVRGGTGLLAAVEFTEDYLREHPSAVADLQYAMRERGYLVRTLLTAIAVSPPLTIGVDVIGSIGDAFLDALSAMDARG
jgi:adenosylmethionine-8-amino-7-oxononanoate aminotransferase